MLGLVQLGQRQRAEFLKAVQESILPFLVDEEWPESIAKQMHRILLIQSVTDLYMCDDALITRLAAMVRKEADAADNEARGIKARVMTWARKVCEDFTAEAHKWFNGPENHLPNSWLIVRSSGRSSGQKGQTILARSKSTLRRIREMAMKGLKSECPSSLRT